MTRPLLISDCDEVLLHMVRHFGDWLGDEHNMDFELKSDSFVDALTCRATGRLVERDLIWGLLDGFFETQMHRQTLVPDAIESLGRIGEIADIVILTNLHDRFHSARVVQLDGHGIRHQVVCNQGGKGRAVRRILAQRAASVALFVDDLPGHHASVAGHVPGVWRLHMVADPDVARLIPPAPDAHNRIDAWAEATDWALARLGEGPAA